MAKKKVKKKAAPVRRAPPARRAPVQPAPMQRARETVRVKTFIVEKPVIIQSKPERIVTPAPEVRCQEPVYDSRSSRYSRRPVAPMPREEMVEEEVFPEEAPKRSFAKKRPAQRQEEMPAEEEEFAEEEGTEGVEVEDDGSYADEENLPEDEEAIEDAGPEGEAQGEEMKSHFRSRGMFLNKWWKKALLWAFLLWAVVFVFGFALEATKLGNIEIGKNWLILFIIILAIELVWHKFDLGRFIKL